MTDMRTMILRARKLMAGKGLMRVAACARAVLLVSVIAPAALGQPTCAAAQPVEAPSLEQTKAALEEIEATLGEPDVGAETLAGLRQKLNATMDALRGTIEELEPRVREAEERLKQLGPAPAKEAPPEAPDIASEREELGKSFSELDGDLKQARVLAVRGDQLSERIAQQRHALYARELFARSASALDPFFWAEAFHAAPIELRRAQGLLAAWRSDHADAQRLIAAALILLGILIVVVVATGWWLPRLSGREERTRAAKAWTALWMFAWYAGRAPLAALAALLAFEGLGLLTSRLDQIAQGLVAGIAAAAFGHGVVRGLFAVEKPQRRLGACLRNS